MLKLGQCLFPTHLFCLHFNHNLHLLTIYSIFFVELQATDDDLDARITALEDSVFDGRSHV